MRPRGDSLSMRAFPRTRLPLLLGLAAALLLAGPAQAIYVVTALRLDPSSAEGEVGDAITFNATPSEDWDGPSFAGATVTLFWNYDPEEGQHPPPEDPDAPVSSDDQNATDPEPTHVEREADAVTLDEASRATFTWTIPPEVDDRNVFLTLRDGEGEVLANAHVRVGDAAPMAFLMAEGGSDADKAASGEPALGEPAGAPAEGDARAGDATRDAPGPGVLALLAALVGGAMVATRRRRV